MSALLENLPDEWELSTLGSLNSRKAPMLNPKDFAEETFEYYSIPDFQRDQRPSVTTGARIESSKLLLKPKTVLFGKLNPRVEKVWRVAESSGYRQIGSTEWITILPTDRIEAVRPMRNKWASCSTAGHLNFSDELLGLKSELWDYVVVHELLHFFVPNHGRLWKSLMRAYLGAYEAHEDELKRIANNSTSAAAKVGSFSKKRIAKIIAAKRH